MSKPKLKAMLIVFFEIKGVIMIECIPYSQTINQKYYIEVLGGSEKSKKEKTRLGKNN